MRITRRQLRQIIKEAIGAPPSSESTWLSADEVDELDLVGFGVGDTFETDRIDWVTGTYEVKEVDPDGSMRVEPSMSAENYRAWKETESFGWSDYDPDSW